MVNKDLKIAVDQLRSIQFHCQMSCGAILVKNVFLFRPL